MHKLRLLILIGITITLMGICSLSGATTYQYHKVRKGDSLYKISKQYGVTVNEIKALNNLSTNRLDIGQELKIKSAKPESKPQPKPKPTPAKPPKNDKPSTVVNNPPPPSVKPAPATLYHTVRKGDSLYKISKQYGVTVNEIKALNNLSGNRLDIGQKLKIKTGKPEPTPQPKPKPKPVPKPTETKPPTTEKTTTVEKPKPSPSETTPGSVTNPEAGPVKIPSDLPEDYWHVVKPKENLYRIALNAKISIPDLLRYNNFKDAYTRIYPGMRLVIKDPATFQSTTPGPDEVLQAAPVEQREEYLTATPQNDSVLIEKVYIVQRKDTLFKIARENNMTVEQLKQRNNLTNNAIKPGQRLYITAPQGKNRQEPLTPIVTEEDLKVKTKIRTDLIMPVDNAKLLSEYGIRNGRPHKGIDLGNSNGMPIYAVLDGTVVYSGVQGSYGNVVVIEHPDFVMTVYAHNEKNLVNVGESVKQGQIIATVGSTGNATGSHCHFEYRIKGKAINPRKVLPIGK